MMSDEQDQRRMCGLMLLGMGIGAVVAGAAAVLLAPKAGSETRAGLTESLNKLKSRADDLMASVREKARATLEDRTSALAQAIEAGKQAYAETRAKLESQVRTDD